MGNEIDPEFYLWGDTSWLCSSSLPTPYSISQIPNSPFFDAYKRTQALSDATHRFDTFPAANKTPTFALPTSGFDTSNWMNTGQSQWTAYNQFSFNFSYPISDNFDLMSSPNYHSPFPFEELGATLPSDTLELAPSLLPLNEFLPQPEQLSLSPGDMLSPAGSSPFTPAIDTSFSSTDLAFHSTIADPHQTHLHYHSQEVPHSMSRRAIAHTCDHNRQGKQKPKEKGAKCPICGKKAPTKRDILRHILGQHQDFAEAHKIKSDKTQCPFPKCDHWARIDNVRRHYKSRHKGVISWKNGCWSLIDCDIS